MAAMVDSLARESELLALRLQEEELQAQRDALLAQRLALAYASHAKEAGADDEVEIVKEIAKAVAVEDDDDVQIVEFQLTEVLSKQGQLAASQLQEQLAAQARAAQNSRAVADVLDEHERRHARIAQHDATFARRLANVDRRTWERIGDDIEEPLDLPPPRKMPKLVSFSDTAAAGPAASNTASAAAAAAVPRSNTAAAGRPTTSSCPAPTVAAACSSACPPRHPPRSPAAAAGTAAPRATATGCPATGGPSTTARQSPCGLPNAKPPAPGGRSPGASSTPSRTRSAGPCPEPRSDPDPRRRDSRVSACPPTTAFAPAAKSASSPAAAAAGAAAPAGPATAVAAAGAAPPAARAARSSGAGPSTAAGPSSSGAGAGPSTTGPTIECSSCFDRFPPHAVSCAGADGAGTSTAAAGCGHYFCGPCMAQYVLGAVRERKCPVPCPMAGAGGAGSCKQRLSRETVMEVLRKHPKDQQAFGLLEAEQAIPARLRIYCPHKSCSMPLQKPDEADMPRDQPTSCPACNRVFCLRCRIPGWHNGYTCGQFQQLPAHLRSAEDAAMLQYSARQQWKRCPQCQQMVERSEGCNHMHCLCSCNFCYACGERYRDTKPSEANAHGTPGCGCPLFDVPPELREDAEDEEEERQQHRRGRNRGRGGDREDREDRDRDRRHDREADRDRGRERGRDRERERSRDREDRRRDDDRRYGEDRHRRERYEDDRDWDRDRERERERERELEEDWGRDHRRDRDRDRDEDEGDYRRGYQDRGRGYYDDHGDRYDERSRYTDDDDEYDDDDGGGYGYGYGGHGGYAPDAEAAAGYAPVPRGPPAGYAAVQPVPWGQPWGQQAGYGQHQQPRKRGRCRHGSVYNCPFGSRCRFWHVEDE